LQILKEILIRLSTATPPTCSITICMMYLTYYGFAFSDDEIDELALRVEAKTGRKRWEHSTNLDVVDTELLLEMKDKAGFLVPILGSWKTYTPDERLKNKTSLLNLRYATSPELPGPALNVVDVARESAHTKAATEWLSSLGYTDEEQEAILMWIRIPAVHTYK